MLWPCIFSDNRVYCKLHGGDGKLVATRKIGKWVWNVRALCGPGSQEPIAEAENDHKIGSAGFFFFNDFTNHRKRANIIIPKIFCFCLLRTTVHIMMT